jgi:hypothetical protein
MRCNYEALWRTMALVRCGGVVAGSSLRGIRGDPIADVEWLTNRRRHSHYCDYSYGYILVY